MKRTIPLFTCLLLLVWATARVHAQSPDKAMAAVQQRFGNIDSIDIALDGKTFPKPGFCGRDCIVRSWRPPRGGPGQASAIFVYVVDSAGRAEKSTVSFIQPGPTTEFREVVCGHGIKTTHTFPAGVPPHRMLIITAITVTVDQDLVPNSLEPHMAEMRNTPRAELFLQLNTLAHCR